MSVELYKYGDDFPIAKIECVRHVKKHTASHTESTTNTFKWQNLRSQSHFTKNSVLAIQNFCRLPIGKILESNDAGSDRDEKLLCGLSVFI